MNEKLINNIPLFANLSNRERRALEKRFKLEEYKKDETIFKKEADSDALYVIEQGRIGLSADGKTNLANLGPGSLLGEADFFQGLPYSVTATASSDVSVWVLTSSDLQTIIEEAPQIGLSLSQSAALPIIQMTPYLADKLAQVSSMENLSADERQQLARRMTAQAYETGEAVFHSDDPATGLFLIEQGTVRLIGGANNDFIELSAGEVFGEITVITGKRHANTAQAAEDTIAWQLSAEDFAAVANEHPEIRVALSRTVTSRLSSADQAHAAEVLAGVPLFSQLPQNALKSAAASLMLRHIPANQPIYRVDDPGDAMYIVETGEVEIRNKQGGLVFRPTEGDYFGDMALLTGKNREDTAIAAQDSNLWAMYRSDFDNLLVKHPQLSAALSKTLQERLSAADNQFVERHLQKLAVLGGLSRLQLDEISARLHARRFKEGDFVFKEGDPGEELFFIENGRVERFATTQAGLIALPILESGDFLGETSLLSNQPHATSARALSDLDIWVLVKEDFDDLIYRYPNLSAVLNRIMSERLVETMNIMRNTQVQPGIPAQAGGGPVPSQARRTTSNVPPIPVKRVVPPTRSRPVPVNPASSAKRVSQPVPPAATRTPSRPVAPSQSNRRVSTPVKVKSRTVRPSAGASISRGAKRVTSGSQNKVDSLSRWFASVPIGTRVGLFMLLLLIIWMCFIAAPAGVISALAATIFDTGAETVDGNNGSNTFANGFAQSGLAAALPFMETVTPTATPDGEQAVALAQVEGTPTPTPILTFTPSPTFTPTPVDTATPTPTPLPTDTPTATPVPPTNTPNRPRAPTDTPTPEPTPTPDADFIVAKVRKLTPCENEGNHHIYIRVVDVNGAGMNNVPVKISWGPNSGDNVIAKTEAKDKGNGFIEFAMFKGTYSVEVLGAKSQVASGITPDFQVNELCPATGNEVANSLYHASFEVILQRTY